MEELSHSNSTSYADLERLAATAITMSYSSENLAVSSHQVINNAISAPTNQNLPANHVASITPQYSSTPYDLSRPHQYTAVRFYPPKPVFEPARTNFTGSSRQHVINATISQLGNNYTVVQRAELQPPRNHHFDQPDISRSIGNPPGIIPDTSVHYIDARAFPVNNNVCVSNESTIIRVSHPPGTILANTQIPSQSVIHLGLLQQEAPVALEVASLESPHEAPVEKKKSIKQNKEKVKRSCDKSSEFHSDESRININEPFEINGKKCFICNLCGEKFVRKYLYKRHQIFHTKEKRGALSLETKAEIIRRIKAGEKQVDLAMEYNVGRSTLSFIMKNSEKFLDVLKEGKFLPNSKRLRGAQREDVEDAIYEWFKQATLLGLPVSGPILCRKAKDFAAKLGYQDFKATHGWLDRFKHRKQIVLGRGRTTKVKEEVEEESDEFKEDFADLILPNILIDYDSNDVFYASEIGLLYKVLPNKALLFKGLRCAGGSHSKMRLTILMCANMTGSEKFPLLVIGKHPKPRCFKNVKSLPVQYLSSEKSWMAKDNFIAWLTDLNRWFEQQNRKILLVVPNLPIHPRSPKLSAVRVIVAPSNFVGPSKLGITESLKRNYRRGILEYLLRLTEDLSNNKKRNRKLSLKLSLLTCLHQLAASWHSVTDVTISNSFQRSGLGKYGLWGMNLIAETTLGTENLDLIHKLKIMSVKIPDGFTFDDFISFDDEVQVCHFMDDDDIIASITGADIESSDSENDVEEESEIISNGDDKENTEGDLKGPSFEEVKTNLDIIRNHIAYQTRGAAEMTNVLVNLEYLLQKTVKCTSIGVEISTSNDK